MANSRAEAILEATINGETWSGVPQSRMEKLLLQLQGGGGSAGTTNYNSLSNLPTIDGKEIKGEVSNDILELVEPLTEEDVTEISNLITEDED